MGCFRLYELDTAEPGAHRTDPANPTQPQQMPHQIFVLRGIRFVSNSRGPLSATSIHLDNRAKLKHISYFILSEDFISIDLNLLQLF